MSLDIRIGTLTVELKRDGKDLDIIWNGTQQRATLSQGRVLADILTSLTAHTTTMRGITIGGLTIDVEPNGTSVGLRTPSGYEMLSLKDTRLLGRAIKHAVHEPASDETGGYGKGEDWQS